MTDKSDQRWREKLSIPNPEQQIGTTPEGDPVILDMRELFSSPNEDAERWAKTIENRRNTLVDQVAHLVLKNAALFMEQTFWNTATDSSKQTYQSGDAKAAFKMVSEAGFEAIQDGLKTIVKHHGVVIRDMHANIPTALADQVAKRVSEIVAQMPLTK